MTSAKQPDAPLYLDIDGPIARLVLNRAAKRNAITQAMWEAIPGLLDRAAADTAVRVVILESSTDTAFSAGADIAEFKDIATDPARREANRIAVREAQRQLARFPKATIARIAGACVGGGCGLALACDLRFAEPGARLGITPARLGLVYSLQDTKQLVDLVGPAQAKSILFTGRLVAADEALRMGLINEVWPADELAGRTTAFAEQIAAVSQHSVAGIKRIVRMILDGVADDTDETAAMFRDAWAGADYAEGVAAFLEKRKPQFR